MSARLATMSLEDKDLMDGEITGDFKSGPVFAWFYE
jgi:hypothetical protein